MLEMLHCNEELVKVLSDDHMGPITNSPDHYPTRFMLHLLVQASAGLLGIEQTETTQ